MRLDEAEKILNDNGYELLDEGKLGRALGIGALALCSLFNNVFATDEFDNRPKIEFEDGSGYKQIKMLGKGKYKIKIVDELFGTMIEEGKFENLDKNIPNLIDGVQYRTYNNGRRSINYYKNDKLIKCLEYDKNTKKFEPTTDEKQCPIWINDVKF